LGIFIKKRRKKAEKKQKKKKQQQRGQTSIENKKKAEKGKIPLSDFPCSWKS
jgi:hypothetical protein